MTARVRITADDTAEIDAITQALGAAGLELAGNHRDYPNRSGFGVRRYIEIQVPAAGGAATATEGNPK